MSEIISWTFIVIPRSWLLSWMVPVILLKEAGRRTLYEQPTSMNVVSLSYASKTSWCLTEQIGYWTRSEKVLSERGPTPSSRCACRHPSLFRRGARGRDNLQDKYELKYQGGPFKGAIKSFRIMIFAADNKPCSCSELLPLQGAVQRTEGHPPHAKGLWAN